MWVLRAFRLDDDRLVYEAELPGFGERDAAVLLDEEPVIGLSHPVEAARALALVREGGADVVRRDDVEWFLDFDAEVDAGLSRSPRPVQDPGPADFGTHGTYGRDLLSELRRDLGGAHGTPLIFIGSGLSVAARPYLAAIRDLPTLTGRTAFTHLPDDHWFPTWDELPLKLGEYLPAEAQADRLVTGLTGPAWDPYELAQQRFRLCLRDERYSRALRYRFEIPQLPFESLPPMHRALTLLPRGVLVTSNYDNLIEAGFASAGRSLTISQTYEDFRRQTPTVATPHLLKLHGTLARPETVVLPGVEAARARVDFKRVLEDVLRRTTISAVLFLGFETGDPTLIAAREDVLVTVADAAPVNYAIVQRVDGPSRLFYDTLGVKTLAIDSWDDAPRLLAALTASESA